MKNIFRAFLAAVALFATVACSQDDNVGRTFGDKAITIDSSSVTFTDAPSTGRVTVKAAGPITKTAVSNDWCKSTFSGNVVTVCGVNCHNIIHDITSSSFDAFIF